MFVCCRAKGIHLKHGTFEEPEDTVKRLVTVISPLLMDVTCMVQLMLCHMLNP